MTGTAPPARPTDRVDEPMAADRRTLTIAAVSMLVLVLVGVVSGALFAGSACDDIGPEVVAAPVASGAGTLPSVLPTLDPDVRADWEEELAALADRLGPVTGIADAEGASRLRASDLGPVALGDAVVQLDAVGASVRDAIEVGVGTVVGGGAHLYSLALPNLLTGQVDALQPLDADLAGLTCVDTALVGSPLAFHLAAGEGQLLLLRLQEDGDDAELELRDPVAGQVWGSDIELPAAPAGLAGSRLTAAMGPEVIVTGTRTGPGETAPVLTAVERADGAPRWQVDREALDAAGLELPTDGPTRADVHRVGEDVALVVLRDVSGTGTADEEAEQDALAAQRQLAVTVALDDGAVRSVVPLPVEERVVEVGVSGERVLVASVDVGGGRTLVRELGDGEARLVAETELGGAVLESLDRTVAASGGVIGAAVEALPGGTAELEDGRRVVVTGGSVVVLPPAMATSTEPLVRVELPATAVTAHPGGVSVLLLGPDEDRAVVTFGG